MKITVLILLISISFGASGQEALSLSDAIALGLKNNYELQITRKSEKIDVLNNHWGNTGALPTINFNMSGRESINLNDRENYHTRNISPEVSLNWVLFSGFSAKITKSKLEEMEQQSKGNSTILIESTIQDIILAYYDCLIQKNMLAVLQELSSLSEDRYLRAENSKKIGAGTSYEMLQAKTSWLEDQSSYLQQKNNFENAIRTLNFVMGTQGDENWKLTSMLTAEMPEYSLTELETQMFSNNQSIKNQYLNQSLLAKETALAKSRNYPSLSLNTGLGHNWLNNYYSKDTPDTRQNATNGYVGFTLSFNLFNGGTTRRSVQIAGINEEMAQIQTKQMKHSLSNQLLQLYSNFNVEKTVLSLAEETVTTARLNLNLSKDRFESGAINSFNYRDVQVVYLNASISKLQAIYNLVQTNTELLRITGGIISEYE